MKTTQPALDPFTLLFALLVALTQPVIGLVFLILIPSWNLPVIEVSVSLPAVRDDGEAFLFPSLPVFSPRPPPIS
jgi:hypothetical protein